METNPENKPNPQENLAVPLEPEHEEILAAALKDDEIRAAAEREAAMQIAAHEEVKMAADLPAIGVGKDAQPPQPTFKQEMARQIQATLTPEDVEKLKSMGPQHPELDPSPDKSQIN